MLVAASAPPPVHAAQQVEVIDTVVGTGDPGNGGDGGPASRATLSRPEAVGTAPDGTLYVVSGLRVRSVDPRGTIHTVFTGKPAKSGVDDGLGGLAVAPDGTLYVADTAHNVVRAVDPDTGRTTTVAGNGDRSTWSTARDDDGRPASKARVERPSALAVGTDGTLYVGDHGSGTVRAVDPRTHRIGTVRGAEDLDADGIAVLGHTLYASDSYDGTVTAVDLHRHTHHVVVDDRTPGPTGTTFFENPQLLTAGPDGRLYIACPNEGDARFTLVYAYDPAKHRLEVVAGGGKTALGDGGPAVGASLGEPDPVEQFGVAVDRKGTVYLADSEHNRVRAVRAEPAGKRRTYAAVGGHDIATVVGGGKARTGVRGRLDVRLDLPTDVAVAKDGTMYVADAGNGVVRAVDPHDGKVRTVAGRPPDPKRSEETTPSGQQATDVDLGTPVALTLGPGGTLYVATVGVTGGVYAVHLGSGTITVASATDTATDVAVGRDGTLYVSSAEEQKVCAVRRGEGSCRTVAGGKDTNPELTSPWALAIDRDGALLIGDAGADRIARLDPRTHQLTTVAGLNRVSGGVFAHVLGPDSTVTPYASGDGGPARSADLGIVSGIDVAPDGTLYLTDAANHRVRAVDRRTGVIRTVAGTGRNRPVDPELGVAGGHIPGDGGGFGGDGGPARAAKLDQPQAVTVGPDGALYVADAGNDRIRAIDAPTLPHGGAGPLPFLVGLALGAVLLGGGWAIRRFRRRPS